VRSKRLNLALSVREQLRQVRPLSNRFRTLGAARHRPQADGLEWVIRGRKWAERDDPQKPARPYAASMMLRVDRDVGAINPTPVCGHFSVAARGSHLRLLLSLLVGIGPIELIDLGQVVDFRLSSTQNPERQFGLSVKTVSIICLTEAKLNCASW
jgi:hypothetical protein